MKFLSELQYISKEDFISFQTFSFVFDRTIIDFRGKPVIMGELDEDVLRKELWIEWLINKELTFVMQIYTIKIVMIENRLSLVAWRCILPSSDEFCVFSVQKNAA